MGPGTNESECEPFKNSFSVCYSPLGPVEVSLVVFQSQIFWGLASHVLVLKGEVPDGYELFTL